MLAVPVASFVLHVGQTRSLRAQTGDVVVCREGTHSIRAKIGRSTDSFAWDKTLSLTITRKPSGRITAECGYR